MDDATLVRRNGDRHMEASRRELLKKAAVGAAVVWTTPILSSIRTPVAAGTPAPTTTPTTLPPPSCTSCENGRVVFRRCGTTDCACLTSTDGDQMCFRLPDVAPSCSMTAECLPGLKCENGFCVPGPCSPGGCPPGSVCIAHPCGVPGGDICVPLSFTEGCTDAEEGARIQGGMSVFAAA